MIINKFVFLGSGLILAVACFCVAVYFGNKKKLVLYTRDRTQLRDYLIEEVGVITATTSNVGSMTSLYVMVVGAILMTFGWGSLLFYSSILGIIGGVAVLWWRMTKFVDIRGDDDLTYVDRLQRTWDGRAALFAILLMFLFCVSTIGSEIQAMKIMFSAASTPSHELIAGELGGEFFQFNMFLLLLCVIYVFRGGCIGVLRTDLLQMALVAIAWGISFNYLNKNTAIISLLSRHKIVNLETILVSIATIILVSGWIVSSFDNWVRTAGSWPEDYRRSNGKVKKKIAHVMVLTGLFGALIAAVPTLIGLHMRDTVAQLMNCGGPHTVKDQKLMGSIKEYVEQNSPLAKFTLKDDICEQVIAPAIDETQPDSYRLYTNFTNSAYIILSLWSQDLFSGLSTGWEQLSYTLVLGLLVLAFLAVSLTTVDSLLLVIAQSLYQFGRNKNELLSNLPLKFRPVLVIPITAFLIGVVSSLPIFDERLYLSVGVFAWSCMIFLSAITLVSTSGATKVKQMGIFQKLLRWLFCVWLLSIVLPHTLFAGGFIQKNQVAFLPEKVIDLLLLRSTMPISGILFVISAFAITAVAWRNKSQR